MLFSAILDRFVNRAPIGVTVRAALECAVDPAAVDALFRETAELQHETFTATSVDRRSPYWGGPNMPTLLLFPPP